MADAAIAMPLPHRISVIRRASPPLRLPPTLYQNLRYLCQMYTRSWLVVKDDGRRTFEAVTANLTENAFTNKVYAMQRDGLNVSYVLLPVTNRQASRESIRVTGYQYEEGLYDRLLKQHQDLLLRQADDFE